MMSKSVLCATFILLLLISMVPWSDCQPVNNQQDAPSSVGVVNDTERNETIGGDSKPSAFGYTYPTGFPRFEMDMNPFRAMERMLSAMEQRFNSLLGMNDTQSLSGVQSSSSLFSGSGGFFGDNWLSSQPCQQTIDQSNQQLLIRCNVSGYAPENIKIDVQGNRLTIGGHRVVQEEGGADGQPAHNSTMQFQQMLYLSDFNMEKMKSSTDSDGILTISVPRIPEQQEKKEQNAGEVA